MARNKKYEAKRNLYYLGKLIKSDGIEIMRISKLSLKRTESNKIKTFMKETIKALKKNISRIEKQWNIIKR